MSVTKYQKQLNECAQIVCAVALAFSAASAQATEAVTNQIHNPEFRGTTGLIDDVGGTEGTINGEIPTLWRTFVRGGTEVTISKEQLSENALFPTSPATTAVTLRVDQFGGGHGFDTFQSRFSLEPGRLYHSAVYMRSVNADSSTQEVTVGFPVFDADNNFLGREPGAVAVTVTSDWALYEGPQFAELLAGVNAELAFRLTQSGTDNAIQIALPTVEGVPLANQAPNPEFEGANGFREGDVSGTIPDEWRGFAVNGAIADFSVEPLAQDALYPGSPASQAVLMEMSSISGFNQGFDNLAALFPLVIDRHYTGQVYLRSANTDMSPVTVYISLTAFDATQSPLPIANNTLEVGSQWQLFSSGGWVVPEGGDRGEFAVRITDASPTPSSLLIAMPKVLGPDLLMESDFEGAPLIGN